MSDLDDLEEIAEASAFGFRSFTCDGIPRQGRRMASPTCKKGHPRTPESTRYRKYKNGKRTRRTCRICDAIRGTARRNAASNAPGTAQASEAT